MENIIQQLLDHNNQQVDEFNEVFDRLEETEAKLQQVQEASGKQDVLIGQQQELIVEFNKQREQHQRDYNKVNLQAKAADIAEKELKKARKELKTLKEQTKRLKAANDEKAKKVTRLEAEVKKVKNAQGEMRLTKEGFLKDANLGAVYTLFKYKDANGELLQLYPHRLTMKAENGKTMQGYVLMHTNNSGTLVTVALDTENEARLLNPLQFPEGTPERTEKLATKFLRPMSTEAVAFANQWLYRVNVEQKGELTIRDLNDMVEI